MITIALANQKGGAGKTTVATHLAFAATEKQYRVLFMDFDTQGSATLTFTGNSKIGNDPDFAGLKASDLFKDTALKVAPHKISEYLSIVVPDRTLKEINDGEHGWDNSVISRPSTHLQALQADFDVCFIDTPPALCRVLEGALVMADYVITPMQIAAYDMDGAAELFDTIERIKQTKNNDLIHSGIVPTFTNTRSNVEKQAIASLRKDFGALLLPFEFSRRAAVNVAVAQRKPIWKNPKGSSHTKAAVEWKTTCDSLIEGFTK